MQLLLRLLPSIVTLAFIASIGYLYLWLVNQWYKDRFNSIEWLETHNLLPVFMIGTPAQLLIAPALEELVFRLPAIVLVDRFPSYKWSLIVIATLLFSVSHWHGTKFGLDELLSINSRREKKLDDLTELVKVVELERRNIVIKRKILHVTTTLFCGFLFTYFGVAYQSLWLSFVLHSMWNLLMPLLVLVVALCSHILVDLLTKYKESILTRRRVC